jgi:transposase
LSSLHHAGRSVTERGEILGLGQPEKEIEPMKKRFTEEQIIGFLREADAGLPVKELCRKHGFSEPSYYAWKARFGGMKVSDAQRLKGPEGRERQAQAAPGKLDARRRASDLRRQRTPRIVPLLGTQKRAPLPLALILEPKKLLQSMNDPSLF